MLKLKQIDKSAKVFPYAVSLIIDVVIDQDFLLPDCSRKLRGFFTYDYPTFKHEET